MIAAHKSRPHLVLDAESLQQQQQQHGVQEPIKFTINMLPEHPTTPLTTATTTTISHGILKREEHAAAPGFRSRPLSRRLRVYFFPAPDPEDITVVCLHLLGTVLEMSEIPVTFKTCAGIDIVF